MYKKCACSFKTIFAMFLTFFMLSVTSTGAQCAALEISADEFKRNFNELAKKIKITPIPDAPKADAPKADAPKDNTEQYNCSSVSFIFFFNKTTNLFESVIMTSGRIDSPKAAADVVKNTITAIRAATPKLSELEQDKVINQIFTVKDENIADGKVRTWTNGKMDISTVVSPVLGFLLMIGSNSQSASVGAPQFTAKNFKDAFNGLAKQLNLAPIPDKPFHFEKVGEDKFKENYKCSDNVQFQLVSNGNGKGLNGISMVGSGHGPQEGENIIVSAMSTIKAGTPKLDEKERKEVYDRVILIKNNALFDGKRRIWSNGDMEISTIYEQSIGLLVKISFTK